MTLRLRKINRVLCLLTALAALFAAPGTLTHAQSTATLRGTVTDPNRDAVPGARIQAINQQTGVQRTTQSNDEGFYEIPALAIGSYRVTVRAPGFVTQTIDNVSLEVARIVSLDLLMQVGNIEQVVTVQMNKDVVDRGSISVGQVVDKLTVREAPLNGRHFIDLSLLVPGSVTPPQNAFLSTPVRGQGSLAVYTAGNREDTNNFQVNGINLNDQINNTLAVLLPIGSLAEFKIDNSTASAEFGRNSGAIVNIASRSGANDFHGELFEYFRNDALDARNFFNFTSADPPPFKRNQFGGSIGGPILLPRFSKEGPALGYNGKNRSFFYFAYEGLRQRQGVDLNSLVLSDQQRISATDPVIRKLIELIPRANVTDSAGVSRFVGSATAAVSVNSWSIDISHDLSDSDRLHGFYASQHDDRIEPNLQGNTIPGFGDVRTGLRHIFTFNETHIFNQAIVNDLRLGFNRLLMKGVAAAPFNPGEFGIRNGVNRDGGLPQISVAGGLNFGGPRQFPNVRGDTTFIASDTLNIVRGRHVLKLGGEYRRFFSNLLLLDSGTFSFPTVAAFINDDANSFSVTLGDRSSSIAQGALDLFAQDSFKWKSRLTLELGLRYSWNMTPTERYDRFIVFDPSQVALVQVGRDIDQVYETNALNFQPRVGFAWDPFGNGKTSVRAAYAIMTEQPMANAVQTTAANPPFATPLTFTGAIRLDNAIDTALASGVAPVSVDHGYENSYIQSWNLNLQQELVPNFALTIGYFGSKGTNLRISRNINQPVNGVRPFPRLSSSSPFLPGASLGNITQVEGTGNSSYNALWVTLAKRLSSGFQFNASYTYSKSIDYNSISSPPILITAQSSNDLQNDRGLSDFDTRHRLVLSAIYRLPLKGNRFVDDWQIAGIIQSQTGNPVNLVTTNSTVTGVANTIRPDVVGPIVINGSVDRWFDPNAFAAASRFGNLGRNVIIGPSFKNVDFSLQKTIKATDELRLQFRAEAFDLFNHPSFGQPGRVVGSPSFGRITNTRFPTGDSGSSRQIQLALKFEF